MSGFDIRAAVRAVIDETDLTDPGDIASKVGGDIPSKLLRSVVIYLLREYVRVTFHGYPPMPTQTRPAASTASNRSAKVAAIRAAAPGWLLRRVHVGDSYLMLTECSSDNLRYLEQARRAKAAQTAAAADWYARAADEVEAAEVDTLGELPAEVLARLSEIGEPA